MSEKLNFEAVLKKYDATLNGLRLAKFDVRETSDDDETRAERRVEMKPRELRSATILGRTSDNVQLVWRLFIDQRGDDYVLWLEATARPVGRELNDAPPPDTQSINHISVEDIVYTIGMDVRKRMTEGVRAALRRDYSEGNLWTTADGRISMWSTAERGDDSPGYTIKLRNGVSAEEMVAEAIARHKNV